MTNIEEIPEAECKCRWSACPGEQGKQVLVCPGHKALAGFAAQIELAALVLRIEALAEEAELLRAEHLDGGSPTRAGAWHAVATELRKLLDGQVEAAGEPLL